MDVTTRARDLVQSVRNSAAAILAKLVNEIGLIVDRDRWAEGATWKDRLSAVSWPRASIAGGVVAVTAASLWLIVAPFGLHAHPPRLPTEREWRATETAAKAFEGDLSPALVAANRTATPETAK